jgi:RNA polymerase sigma factor (sigma-70 family)
LNWQNCDLHLSHSSTCGDLLMREEMDNMDDTSDSAFLKQYALSRSQPAFRELMLRHLDLVYAACLRQVREPNLAEDVTQAVFIILANKAATLGTDMELAGWLIKTARYASLTAMRAESRRRKHELEAALMASEITFPTDEAKLWEKIAPLLDAALVKLSDSDRSVIVLRYMQDKPYDQIATAMAISPEAARQRISRALARLRQQLKKMGVFSAPESLMTVLPMSAAIHAPLGLVETMTTGSAIPGPACVAAARSTIRLMKLASWQMVSLVMSVLVFAIAAMAIHWSRMSVPLPSIAATVPPATTLITVVAPSGSDVSAQLVDPDGRPVSNAVVDVAGDSIWRGQRADTRGVFTLPGAAKLADQLIAYSQRSRRLALFSRNTDGSLPPQVILQYTEAYADGVVVDPNGLPVVNTDVYLFVITPDGQRYPLYKARTDNTGYYNSDVIPSGRGLKLIATLSNSTDGHDTTGPIAMREPYQIEMPDLISDSRPGKAGATVAKRVQYSGRVVDARGKGIAGAQVQMDFPKNNMIYLAGTVLTDTDGHFTRLLPPGAANVNIQLTHSDFVDNNAAIPSVEEMTKGEAVFVMMSALSLRGFVHDSSGQPIENALVLAAGSRGTTGLYQEPIEDFTTPRTDKFGRFIARGLSEGSRDVVISSDDFVPVRLNVDVTASAKPLDVTLDRGVSYTARIVDAEGKGIADCNVSCMNWSRNGDFRGSSSPLARFTTTAADGSFTLVNLPKSGWLDLSATAPGRKQLAGMQFEWSAETGAEHRSTITLYPYPVIEGKVVDADSGNPIRKFKVIPGWDTGRGFSKLDFEYSQTFNPGDGSFSKRIDGFSSAIGRDDKFQVQISADGYTAELSPPVTLGEEHDLFVIKLKKLAPK